MSGLSKVLLYLDKKNVHLLVVYIFMKIKPFLESVSFRLNGENMLRLRRTSVQLRVLALVRRRTTTSAALPSI